MTPNKEDYLKALYQQGLGEGLVSNKQIADSLQVAPASVTEMLIKLSREELIYYEPYKGSRLTPRGRELAVGLVRGHRLWEVFLQRHLGYTWSEAHEDAELLEHITPPRLTGRLEKFLDYPVSCPHGQAIPQTDGRIEDRRLMTLDRLPPGCLSYIRLVTEEKELMDDLQAMGITLGMTVRMLQPSADESPIKLALGGRQVEISRKAARQIYVDEAN